MSSEENSLAACCERCRIISFISVMTHIGVGESFLFTSHTMLLSPSYKCYMFRVLSKFRSDKFQNKQILGCKNFLKLLYFNVEHVTFTCFMSSFEIKSRVYKFLFYKCARFLL